MTGARSGLALLCGMLSDSSVRLTPEQDAEVRSIIADARAGGQIRRRVHLLASALDIRLPDAYRGARFLGDIAAHPIPQIFGCPSRECTRRWVRRPGSETPFCVVSGCLLTHASEQ